MLIGTFFRAGSFPIAAGTFASLLAALVVLIFPPFQDPLFLAFASLSYLLLGMEAATVIERALKLDDPGMIVADEVVGQWIALIPWFGFFGIWHAVIAFVYFRFFDIVKVWPASVLEKQHGGFGVMMDDVVAGVYANIATFLTINYLFGAWLSTPN